jgi:hypothetical protein
MFKNSGSEAAPAAIGNRKSNTANQKEVKKKTKKILVGLSCGRGKWKFEYGKLQHYPVSG